MTFKAYAFSIFFDQRYNQTHEAKNCKFRNGMGFLKILNVSLVKKLFIMILFSSLCSVKADIDEETGLYVPQRRIKPDVTQVKQDSEQSTISANDQSGSAILLKKDKSKTKKKPFISKGQALRFYSKACSVANYAVNPDQLILEKAIAPMIGNTIFGLKKSKLIKKVRAYKRFILEIPQLKIETQNKSSKVLILMLEENLCEIDKNLGESFVTSLCQGKEDIVSSEQLIEIFDKIDRETIFQRYQSLLNDQLYYLTGSEKYKTSENKDSTRVEAAIKNKTLLFFKALGPVLLLPIFRMIIAPWLLSKTLDGYGDYVNGKELIKASAKFISNGKPFKIPADKLKGITEDQVTNYQLHILNKMGKLKTGEPTGNKFNPYQDRPAYRAMKLLWATRGQANLVSALLYGFIEKSLNIRGHNINIRPIAEGFAMAKLIAEVACIGNGIAQVCDKPNKALCGTDKTMTIVKAFDDVRNSIYNHGKSLNHKYYDKSSMWISGLMPIVKTGTSQVLSKRFKTPKQQAYDLVIDTGTNSILHEITTRVERSNLPYVRKHPVKASIGFMVLELLLKIANPILKIGTRIALGNSENKNWQDVIAESLDEMVSSYIPDEAFEQI